MSADYMTVGTKIYARGENEAHYGTTTGGKHRCTMEGCNGLRIAVRWDRRKHTFPCSKGLVPYKDGWRIA